MTLFNSFVESNCVKKKLWTMALILEVNLSYGSSEIDAHMRNNICYVYHTLRTQHDLSYHLILYVQEVLTRFI